MKLTHFGIGLTIATAFLVAIPAMFDASRAFAGATGQEAADPSEYRIQVDLGHQLNKERFKDVRVSVKDEVITLTGNVALFADKQSAEEKAIHAKKDIAVRNEIRITGTSVSDKDLQEKLVTKLEYDRVGYGTTSFNAISVSVNDGVVTLGGHAYGPMDKSSALSVASYTPGVQDVIDEIEVDPTSLMDDRIRLNLARLIYSYPSLFKYALDPGKPIRISVQNGNVTLYGSVDSQSDRDTAGIVASSASGVFKVVNELQVEGGSSERN